MATRKSKGLGRGLDALLGGSSDMAEDVPVTSGSPSMIPITDLQAGKYQPRSRMDEGALNELAASIKEQG
ncbi:MAG TPA: ParB N-terminal domain-containing protein, partial [Herbaspirillum sp.]|nr:ParB N-terminal domain-containing protein [Herbaspirillum sp.]